MNLPRMPSSSASRLFSSAKTFLSGPFREFEWLFLYGYSLFFAVFISVFSDWFPALSLHADNLLTTLSAKLALRPFLWDDSRLGYIFAYILHPFSFLRIYELYAVEVALRLMFVAFIPVGLLMLYGKKHFGYLLIPAFYLISNYCNLYTRDTVSGAGVYYYYTSFALLIGTQLLALKIQEKARLPWTVAALSIPLLFLCMVTYWVNLSLLMFAVPYLFYLYRKGIGDRKFIILNFLGWIPSMLLSNYTEVYGKSYTHIKLLHIVGAVILIKNFFLASPPFGPVGGPVQGLLFLLLACGAAAWGVALLRRPDIEVDGRFRTFYLATLIGSAVFVLAASMLTYTSPTLQNSNRYITVIMLFLGFWAPLGYWELAKLKFPALQQKKYADKVFKCIAAAFNIVLLGVLICQFGVPKMQFYHGVVSLEKIARDNDASIILASDDTPGHYYHADYWAAWPVLFRTLEEGGSLKNAIIPITFRSAAIANLIDAALPGVENHRPFRALCIGADEHICKQMTSQAGFFYFSDYPKTVVAKIPYAMWDKEGVIEYPYDEFTPISVLEFQPMDKGTFGSMLDMVKVYKPAVLTPSHILHIPTAPAPYLAAADFDSIAMRLLPGDYHVALHCTVKGQAGANESLGDLSIKFLEKGIMFRKENLTAENGIVDKSFTFNVPDFVFLVPRVLFLWNTAGKVTLDCDEFRLSQLPKT